MSQSKALATASKGFLSSMKMNRSTLVDKIFLWTIFFLNVYHKVLIGFRSGLFAGHVGDFICLSWRKNLLSILGPVSNSVIQVIKIPPKFINSEKWLKFKVTSSVSSVNHHVTSINQPARSFLQTQSHSNCNYELSQEYLFSYTAILFEPGI